MYWRRKKACTRWKNARWWEGRSMWDKWARNQGEASLHEKMFAPRQFFSLLLKTGWVDECRLQISAVILASSLNNSDVRAGGGYTKYHFNPLRPLKKWKTIQQVDKIEPWTNSEIRLLKIYKSFLSLTQASARKKWHFSAFWLKV